MPEGTVDVIPVDLVVAAIIAVAALGPERAPRRSPRSRRAASTRSSTGRSSTTCSGWFTEHPLYDAEGQPIVVPEWRFPGRGRVQGQLDAGQDGASTAARRCCRRCRCAASRPSWSATLEDEAASRSSGPSSTSSCTASTPSARRSTRSTTCWRCWDALDAGRPRGVRLRPARRSTGRTTSPRSTCRRSSSTPASRPRRARRSTDRIGAAAPPGAVPERHVAAFDLENTLIASNVVESYSWLATRRLDTRRAGPLRAAHAGRGARPAGARPHGPQRLPAPLLPPLRGRAGRPDRRRRRRAARAADPHQELPGRHPPRPRAPGARPPHVLITGALDFVVEPLRPLFDEIIAAEMSVRARRHATRAS